MLAGSVVPWEVEAVNEVSVRVRGGCVLVPGRGGVCVCVCVFWCGGPRFPHGQRYSIVPSAAPHPTPTPSTSMPLSMSVSCGCWSCVGWLPGPRPVPVASWPRGCDRSQARAVPSVHGVLCAHTAPSHVVRERQRSGFQPTNVSVWLGGDGGGAGGRAEHKNMPTSGTLAHTVPRRAPFPPPPPPHWLTMHGLAASSLFPSSTRRSTDVSLSIAYHTSDSRAAVVVHRYVGIWPQAACCAVAKSLSLSLFFFFWGGG